MRSHIFQWRTGNGWLVLAGRGNLSIENSDSLLIEVIADVLSRTISHNPLAYIWAAGNIEAADRALEFIADLGGRTGYLVDVITEDDETLRQELEDAGIIVIGDGDNKEALQSALTGVVESSILSAYQHGATVVGLGAGAEVLGEWIAIENGFQTALQWLENAFVVTEDNEELVRQFLSENPHAYSIVIKDSAAIAFSPEGAVEIWGNKQITVALGQQIQP